MTRTAMQEGQAASTSGGTQTPPTIQEVKARLEAEGRLPSQTAKA